MKKMTVVVLAGLMSASAFADQGDILARLRVISVSPQVSTDGMLSTLHTSVKSDVVPELDFTYMITNNIGAELILGTSRHEVKTDATGSLGKVSVLPPTVTLQYHFTPQSDFRPYVGVGVNYTNFYSNDLHLPSGGKVDVESSSFGPALQIGADYAINKTWFVNVDVKKLYISTKVSTGGTDLGTLHIDPWVYGIGIGTKF
jgi:outer membrane protein